MRQRRTPTTGIPGGGIIDATTLLTTTLITAHTVISTTSGRMVTLRHALTATITRLQAMTGANATGSPVSTLTLALVLLLTTAITGMIARATAPLMTRSGTTASGITTTTLRRMGTLLHGIISTMGSTSTMGTITMRSTTENRPTTPRGAAPAPPTASPSATLPPGTTIPSRSISHPRIRTERATPLRPAPPRTSRECCAY